MQGIPRYTTGASPSPRTSLPNLTGTNIGSIHNFEQFQVVHFSMIIILVKNPKRFYLMDIFFSVKAKLFEKQLFDTNMFFLSKRSHVRRNRLCQDRLRSAREVRLGKMILQSVRKG